MNPHKGYAGIQFMRGDEVDTKLVGIIESGNETERTAARMLKAMAPLMREILASGDVGMLSGFVRGLSSMAATMVFSLPPNGPREAVRRNILSDIERALTVIKHPDEK